jgi:hypothetical protein
LRESLQGADGGFGAEPAVARGAGLSFRSAGDRLARRPLEDDLAGDASGGGPLDGEPREAEALALDDGAAGSALGAGVALARSAPTSATSAFVARLLDRTIIRSINSRTGTRCPTSV